MGRAAGLSVGGAVCGGGMSEADERAAVIAHAALMVAGNPLIPKPLRDAFSALVDEIAFVRSRLAELERKKDNGR